jgi:hypothetical protein
MVSQVMISIGIILLSHYIHLGKGKINELFLPKINNIITSCKNEKIFVLQEVIISYSNEITFE